MSKAAELAALIGSQTALSHRNRVVNGAMNVAQRGTSFTSQGSGAAYHLDRWEVSSFNPGDGVYSVTQSTTVPSGFTSSTKIACTTADTSQDANNQFYFQQQIEAQDINHLKFYTSNPDTVTLSFHVRSNRTGTFPVALKISDNNSVDDNTATRIYQVTYSVSAANTWEKKSVAFTLDSSAQTKPTGSNFGMAVQFWLGAGSNRDGATANAWGDNGNATIAADNLDILGSTSNDWYITGVQLEVGEQATPFEHRSFADELAKCQRYFTTFEASWIGVSEGAGYHQSALVSLPVHMRTTPSVARTGGSDSTRYPASAAGFVLRNTTSFAFFVTAQSAGGNDSWQAIGTADAEL